VTSQESEVLVYTAAEAWNHEWIFIAWLATETYKFFSLLLVNFRLFSSSLIWVLPRGKGEWNVKLPVFLQRVTFSRATTVSIHVLMTPGRRTVTANKCPFRCCNTPLFAAGAWSWPVAELKNDWRKSGTGTGFSPNTSLSLSLHQFSITVFFKTTNGKVKIKLSQRRVWRCRGLEV
jgi:hypothetical protein